MKKSKLWFYLKRAKNIPYNTYLCIRFPFLYPRNRYSGRHYTNWGIEEKLAYLKSNISPGNSVLYVLYDALYSFLAIFHCLPLYTELDAMPIGWRREFGVQLCKEIKKELKRDGLLKSYRIFCIKEKFGYLVWDGFPSNNNIFDILAKYEIISYHTCMDCGAPAHYISRGWVAPYCSKCAPNGSIERTKFYGYDKA